MGYREPAPPIVWKNIVIAGSALGDQPPFDATRGSITALNRTNGDKIWNITTTLGPWIQGKNATVNGGGMVWSGGSLDPKTGIIYVPFGNAAPDFNATSRPGPNPLTSSIAAVDVRNGHVLWATQLITQDTHDWDTAWGTSIANITVASSSSSSSNTVSTSVSTNNGTTKSNNNSNNNTIAANTAKFIIGQTKRGDLFALDARNGHVVWSDKVGIQYHTDAVPRPQGSGTVWPGTQYGVEAFHANDNDTCIYSGKQHGI